MKKKTLVLFAMVISIIIEFSLFQDVHAIAGLSSPHRFTARIDHVVRVVPRPPGWPQMWLAANVIKSFNENGLKVEKAKNEKGIELSRLPAKTNESIKFSVSFNEQKLKGCILEFDKKKDFDKVKNHYFSLNNSGELHTWSLIKDNILLVIEGSMPDQVIRKYEAVLAGIK